MKPSVLGLAIAAVAFAASTAYLSIQLNEQHAQADKLAEATRALNARIAELEYRGGQHVAMSGAFGHEAFGQGTEITAAPADSPPSKEGVVELRDVAMSTRAPPPRNEAFEKMMRSQMRANNKRLYADLGPQLGLNKDEAARLIDLLTDQQLAGFSRGRDANADPAERKRLQDETNRNNQAEIDSFLGVSKAAALRDYQDTIPARQELDAITRQLEGADAGISEDQRKRLLAALIDEHKRIPMPRVSDATNAEEYSKAYAEWQSDYAERVNSQARTILNGEQLAAYADYQQWQSEMRSQMVRFRAGAVGTTSPGGPPGPVFNATFTMAAPVAGEAVVISTADSEPAERSRNGK